MTIHFKLIQRKMGKYVFGPLPNENIKHSTSRDLINYSFINTHYHECLENIHVCTEISWVFQYVIMELYMKHCVCTKTLFYKLDLMFSPPNMNRKKTPLAKCYLEGKHVSTETVNMSTEMSF